MSVSEKLPKSERIHSERRIDALFKEGRRGQSEPLRYCFRVETASISTAGPNPHPVWDATIGINDDTPQKDASSTGCDPRIESTFYRETFPNGNEAPVAIMVSVPKKSFKRAWKRNLIKRRIKESYRRRKQPLIEKTAAAGHHIDIAFICIPTREKAGTKGAKEKASRRTPINLEIPDFKTIDNAVAKILGQILERS